MSGCTGRTSKIGEVWSFPSLQKSCVQVLRIASPAKFVLVLQFAILIIVMEDRNKGI